MAEITEAEVEAVARVICVAHGFEPDESAPDRSGWASPRWMHMRDTALTEIAAHRAIAAFREDGGADDSEAGRSFVLSMGEAWDAASAHGGAEELAASILAELDRAGFQIVRRQR